MEKGVSIKVISTPTNHLHLPEIVSDFACLCSRFIKCSLYASVLQAVSGVPALLVYRKGELIGNFVHLSDEFGDEFYSTDVESFLIEQVH